MSKEKFRIGLIFTPDSLLSVGVLNGNDPQAYKFIGKIQPLIDDFMERVAEISLTPGPANWTKSSPQWETHERTARNPTGYHRVASRPR